MNRFPLSEHICHLKEVIEAPAYVTSKPVVDLGLEQNVNILSDWPNEPLGDLDQSQWKALRQILSKKLAIVQGPPGTGKTHVSVAALKILLSNVGEWEPPIVVAAQTNHALDQLLNHIAQFEPNFVRLGGRSSDENIKKRTLFEIRQINPTPSLVGGLLAPSKKRLQHIIELVSNLLKPFAFENSEAPLQARLFRDHELLSREQYASMQEGARGWTGSVLDDEQDPMATWLGDTQIKYDVLYGEESFKFEEEDMDLEYEQLKEMEAERGIDEELETLKGFFMHLKEGRIGQGSSGISEKYIVDTHLKRNDVWQIPTKHRGAVYNFLCKRLKEKILATYRNLLLHYEETSTHLLTGKWERDFVSLKETKVVGMTTTGLSKYRALLSCLKPKIIMIEEAAEVIEAPVVVACVESLEHLILVGDHKQLQGRCDVQDLGGDPFFLDMSMFERLVHNNVDYRTLTLQRRMAPEIRRLLTPIYDTLEDHPSVNDYEKVPGMGDIRSFFFCHSWSENSDSLASKYNTEEAQMVVGFFLYLVFNGTSVKNITVLTFYNGQRKKILKLLKDNRYLQGQYVKVATADSYQGEENEVVLLSLVRSNEEQKIGFLAVENRVCVAMSRAKRGFYVFGNGQILATVDPLWWEITKIMGNGDEAPRRIGFHLPLTCENHGNKIFVKGNVSFWFLLYYFH
jgi:helicase required for RNAi-mediated heterochromatin assembly 1